MLKVSAIIAPALALIISSAAWAGVVAPMPWPGAGAGQPSPNAGYPPVSFWKEEGVVGNNWLNTMIDQNGTIYDIHYPGAGAVNGVGTRNEGYAGGYDTFPPFTSGRGQMNVNQYMAGIRVDGTTHWYSNPNAVSYSQITQSYHPTSQTITTTRRLNTGAANLFITQYDLAPKLEGGPIAYPTYTDSGTQTNRGLYVQRHLIRNDGAAAKTVDFYFYADWALNGGDGSDGAYDDVPTIAGQPAHAMIAYDNTGGTASSRGEYDPTTAGGYTKNVSLFLGAALKVPSTVGGSGGNFATDTWRTLGSTDNGQGWIGREFTVNPGQTVEVDVLIAGGFKPAAGVANVGDVQIRPALVWFQSNSMAAVQTQTDAWWTNWLNSGTTITTPDANYNKLFNRGLLATALHVDAAKGGIIAGFHNGAYPFCWPRDAVYAAVTFARTGHFAESAGVYTWMRDTCSRAPEPWGKGFWKQKYTTDGAVVWGAPQIDETAVFPWGVKWHYDATGDSAFLTGMYSTVKEAAITMTTSPSNPSDLTNLNYNPTTQLMYSNNVWEDQYDFHIYSNANIIRGLDDAKSLAAITGNPADATDFQNRRNAIKSGLDARLDANAEQTDISQLGLVYPFQVYSPLDPRAVKYIDRINGVQNDVSGHPRPLVRFNTLSNQSGGWVDLLDRYSNDPATARPDTYWNGGPWFLSTMWYGLFYAERADYSPGKADIDNHKYRIDLLVPKLGPLGLGAEQISGLSPASGPTSPLLYPNQTDFVLQTAWPNAWESMSTFVDSLMAFADFRPDAPNNALALAPKLPTGWSTLTYSNLTIGAKKINLTISELGSATGSQTQVFTNTTGGTLSAQTAAKIPAGSSPCSVLINGIPQPYTFDRPNGIIKPITISLSAGVGAITTIEIRYHPGNTADWDHSGSITIDDIFSFLNSWFAGSGDFDGVGGNTIDDIFVYLNAWFTGCT